MRDEVFLQHFAYVRLVIDDQDGGFRAHGSGSTALNVIGVWHIWTKPIGL